MRHAGRSAFRAEQAVMRWRPYGSARSRKVSNCRKGAAVRLEGTPGEGWSVVLPRVEEDVMS